MNPYVFEEFGDIAMIEDTSALGVFLGVYLVFIALSMVYSVVVYILHSLGLYSIAKRRGIHHAWMSWFSPLSIWILGSISDQYQFVAKGKVRNRRKVLLGLYITLILLLVGFAVFIVAMAIGAESGSYDIEAGAGVGLALGFVAVYLAFFVIGIVMTVFQYIAYYDLFVSCNPDNAVAFLVLSIFFTFLLPFFVFACRKKDLGMPPKKPRLPETSWQPPQPNTWQQPQPNAWQPPQPNTWQQPQPNTWQQPQPSAWQPPQPNTWQPPQPSAWQPPQPNTWQQPQPDAWQPPQETAWQEPEQPVQPVSTVQAEPEEAEAPKTEE